jgi:hypothetical protein
MPSQRIRRGSSAILGIGKVAAMSGVPTDADRDPGQPARREAQEEPLEARGQVGHELARPQHLDELPDDRERGWEEEGRHPADPREDLPQRHETDQRQRPHAPVLPAPEEARAVLDGDPPGRGVPPARAVSRAHGRASPAAISRGSSGTGPGCLTPPPPRAPPAPAT